MMTLDEAIKHCNEVACKHDECAMEHKQLAQWLMELKGYKEQKLTDKVEPKFEVGDWVIYCGKTYQITGLHHDTFTLTSCDGSYFFNNIKSTKEPVFHLWTLQDAKDGDVLCYKDEILLYKYDIKNCTKQEITFGGFVYYCCYDGKRFITDSLYSLTEQDKMDIHPATKEQCDLLFQKMKESGYEWDAEKKELKKIELRQEELTEFEKAVKQVMEEAIECGDTHNLKADADMLLSLVQKPAWSEEDKERYISCLQRLGTGNPEQPETINSKWFKEHVYPQSQWKPSDEQMKALWEVYNGGEDQAVLASLYSDLKKLKQ